MPETVRLDRIDGLSEDERAAGRALAAAVYPPEFLAHWPGKHVEWSGAEWCVRVFAEDGALVSYAGVLVRDGESDGQPVRIGGLGGVKTHPAARKQGYARRAVLCAADFLRDRPDVDFALLVCEPRLLDYYGGFGWGEFTGELRVLQRGAQTLFTLYRVMTLAARVPAPRNGIIDLHGPPW